MAGAGGAFRRGVFRRDGHAALASCSGAGAGPGCWRVGGSSSTPSICPIDRAGLSGVRVDDLKHSFGRRLRAAGVSFEDRQDILGQRSGRITTHCAAAELGRLIEAVERVAEQNGRRPELVVLRGKPGTSSRKIPTQLFSNGIASRLGTSQAIEKQWCGRGDSNPHSLAGNGF